MKTLLATTAIALVAMASTASAQSVLERVLGQIDNSTNLASVNGTFANIAENIGGTTAQNVWIAAGGGDVITDAEYQAADALDYQSDFNAVPTTFYVNPTTLEVLTVAQHSALSAADQANYETGFSATAYYENGSTVITETTHGNLTAANPFAAYTADSIEIASLEGIDGSINNVVDGITEATETAVAGLVTSVEFNMPTLNFGDMATTALGAVNTGEITLGVNSSVDNAKTTSTEAVSSVMEQLGGSADTGAIVMNIASNMTGINGSINNTMTEVNGTVGDLSTTALGAVNTGEIISGVNAAVTGITGASSGQAGVVPAGSTTGG